MAELFMYANYQTITKPMKLKEKIIYIIEHTGIVDWSREEFCDEHLSKCADKIIELVNQQNPIIKYDLGCSVEEAKDFLSKNPIPKDF